MGLTLPSRRVVEGLRAYSCPDSDPIHPVSVSVSILASERCRWLVRRENFGLKSLELVALTLGNIFFNQHIVDPWPSCAAVYSVRSTADLL